MKIVDVNVLVHAVNQSASEHERAREWLKGALGGRSPIGFAWLVIVSFLRLTTHPRVLPVPLAPDRAAGVMRTWLDTRAAETVTPAAEHMRTMAQLMGDLSGGDLFNDAHLAALALEHDGEVITFDRDFGRFEGVRWSTPSPT